MPRVRLSGPASADLADILSVSAERWGADARRRYAALLTAAMRQAAADPSGRFVRQRDDLQPGLRSLHARFSRKNHLSVNVKRPAHVVYFRLLEDGFVLIVRILHERMDPARHLKSGPDHR